MKKPKNDPKSFTYTCSVCGRLTVDLGYGERALDLCAYCFKTKEVEEAFQKKRILAKTRDERISLLKEEFHRK